MKNFIIILTFIWTCQIIYQIDKMIDNDKTQRQLLATICSDLEWRDPEYYAATYKKMCGEL